MTWALLASALCAASCSKSYKDIDVKNMKLENISLSSLNSVDAVFVVEIDNPVGQKFSAEKIKGVLYHKGEAVGTFYSNDVVVISPKSVSQSKLKIRITIDSPLGLIGKLTSEDGRDMGNYTLDIGASVTNGVLKIPYSKKGMKVSGFIKKDPKNFFD